jgi:hypothetical protein
MSFTASALPDGAFPMQVVVVIAGNCSIVVISERSELVNVLHGCAMELRSICRFDPQPVVASVFYSTVGIIVLAAGVTLLNVALCAVYQRFCKILYGNN